MGMLEVTGADRRLRVYPTIADALSARAPADANATGRDASSG
jgi:hypothetical protein